MYVIICGHTHTHRKTHTYTHTHTQTDRQTHTQKDTHTQAKYPIRLFVSTEEL
jgi:hypothetical protein